MRDELSKNLYSVLLENSTKTMLMGCRSLDFVLYKHEMITGDNSRYRDDLTVLNALSYLAGEVEVLEANDYGGPATEMEQMQSGDGCAIWSDFVKDIGIAGKTLGELRQAMKEENFTLGGLGAQVALESGITPSTDSFAGAVFMQRLFDYQTSENHHDNNLWYLQFNGKLGKCSYDGEKRWAQTHLKNGDVVWDKSLMMYVATRQIDNEGCTQVSRHRSIIGKIGENWNSGWIKRIEMYFDGGCDCTMTIDTDFKTAYDQDYHDDSSLEGDFVNGVSCMSRNGDRAQEFYGKIHGCYVVRFENADKEQVGRCIMYEYNGIRHFIRIYAKKDYQNVALRLLNAEMRPNDIKGRRLHIDGLELETDLEPDSPAMWLDGNDYGLFVRDDGKICVRAEVYDNGMDTTSRSETVGDNLGIIRCAHCGKYHARRRGIRVYTRDSYAKYYCSEDCAMAEGFVKCERCDTWFKPDEGVHTEDGHFFCENYCAQQRGYRKCHICGKYKKERQSLYSLEGYYYCSDECASIDGCVTDIEGNVTNIYGTTAGGKYINILRLIGSEKLMKRYKVKLVLNRHYKNKGKQNEENRD